MIYSDGVHLISDHSLDDLHRYCKEIGIKRCWYHSNKRFPHYDIPKKRRATFFIDFPDVIKIDSRKIVEILKKVYS